MESKHGSIKSGIRPTPTRNNALLNMNSVLFRIIENGEIQQVRNNCDKHQKKNINIRSVPVQKGE